LIREGLHDLRKQTNDGKSFFIALQIKLHQHLQTIATVFLLQTIWRDIPSSVNVNLYIGNHIANF